MPANRRGAAARQSSDRSQRAPTARFRDRVVELRRVRASELRDHPQNWRRHSDSQRSAVRALLEDIGIADALIAYESAGTLVLIDGHLRKDLEPDAVLPVLVLDVLPEEARALLASLDPLSSMAVADDRALAELLEAAAVPEELLEELQRSYLRELRTDGRADPDDIPKRPRRSRLSTGELWSLGRHRLICGDATDPSVITRLMGDDRAEVMWTDPPYGVGYVGRTSDRLTIDNDDGHGLPALLASAFEAVDAVLRPGGRLYVCHPAGPLSLVFGHAFVRTGWRLHQSLVWAKDRMVLGHADYHYRHEPILYGYKPGPGRYGRGHRGWYGGDDQDSIIEVDRPAASRDHPTAKPVELVERCLQNSSRVGAVVLDPFAGSGSTLIACEELRRRARLVEIDPGYCELIVRRWEAFTGEGAVRLGG